MRLLIIRHGEPDYSIDSLTEKGWREAHLLRDRLVQQEVTAFYCSPLGRARDTAAPTLTALQREATICDWMREFDGHAIDPVTGQAVHPWDRMPAFVNENAAYYDPQAWLQTPFYGSGDMKEKYAAVCQGVDALLAQHGYVHEGRIYRVERENTDTLVLFCHFAVECVMLAHLLGLSPVPLWQGFVALPTAVTTLHTEEREQGVASLRCSGFGDLSHLYAAGEAPSFHARFCETYSNFNERH